MFIIWFYGCLLVCCLPLSPFIISRQAGRAAARAVNTRLFLACLLNLSEAEEKPAELDENV